MKINDKDKGLNYNPAGMSDDDMTDYYNFLATQEEATIDGSGSLLGMIEQNEKAQAEWERQGEENLKLLLSMQKPLVEQFKKKEAIAKSKGKEIDYSGDSFIGERIEFLLDKNNQEITEFCRNIGMSRSSIHRYIKGTHLPSEKSLRKIIDGLFVSVADFCYAPDNFEKWKTAFVKTADNNDIFDFKEKILKELRLNNFTYMNNGLSIHLPNRYFELFRNLIKQSFEVLELLPHDKKK